MAHIVANKLTALVYSIIHLGWRTQKYLVMLRVRNIISELKAYFVGSFFQFTRPEVLSWRPISILKYSAKG